MESVGFYDFPHFIFIIKFQNFTRSIIGQKSKNYPGIFISLEIILASSSWGSEVICIFIQRHKEKKELVRILDIS